MSLHKKSKAILLLSLATVAITSHYYCSQPEEKPATAATTEPVKKELSEEEKVAKGKYLLVLGGCNHCHSPKIMGPKGPDLDNARLMSGHAAGSPLPAITYDATKPGNFLLGTGDLTAWIGPWGMSFAANLTPDSTTGIGSWTVDVFIKTLRTGKHLGQPGGRDLLPPMPWQDISMSTDEDLGYIFTYLQSLPAIKNQVPAPIPPNEVMKKK